MYAIQITGSFSKVKTRAFPTVDKEPFPILSTILDRQHFFEIKQTSGVMVGFKLPSYLNGVSIDGFHFHYLTNDGTEGGHLLGFTGSDLVIEIMEMTDFVLNTAQDSTFMNYEFNKPKNIAVEKVEKGH